MSRYTEGVMRDGAAILDDGQPVPVESVVERLNNLEAALEDAYPFVCVSITKYASDNGLSGLHDTHAEIADRIARLLGKARMPSDVLTK